VSGKPHEPHGWQKRFDDVDLTRRILDRTSGRACGRAEDLLGARWDADNEPLDRELLDGHLAGCAACRELDTILDRLQPLLPGLAEREPGPAFTARVLAQTSRVRPVPSLPAPGRFDRLVQRATTRLRGVWNRPRFALEAAWTAAALTALLVWSPLAPSAAQEQVTGVARAGAGAAPELVARIEMLAESAVLAGREILGPHAERVEREAGEITADLRVHFENLKQAGQSLWQRLTGDDPQSASE
jgi:hypothetical protein